MKLIDPPVCCEGCGVENDELRQEVRKVTVATGKPPKIPVPPLRNPFLCDECLALLPFVFGAARALADAQDAPLDGQRPA